MPRSCQGKKKEEWKKNKTRLVPNHGDCGGDAKVLPRQIWQRPREYSDDPVTNPSGIAIWCRSITLVILLVIAHGLHFEILGILYPRIARCPLANLMGICIPMNLKTFSFVHYCIFRFFMQLEISLLSKLIKIEERPRENIQPRWWLHNCSQLELNELELNNWMFFEINTRFHNNR